MAKRKRKADYSPENFIRQLEAWQKFITGYRAWAAKKKTRLLKAARKGAK